MPLSLHRLTAIMNTKEGNLNRLTAFFKITIITYIFILTTGCASNQRHHADYNDPLESYNRVMYSINDSVDSAILKPISQGYDFIMPPLLSKGISNFFSNLDDVNVVINDLLQFKLIQALQDTSRFAINSTVGVMGVVDVASNYGFKKHNEDFGQTLGAWGLNTGPYIVLPLFGPSDLRDTIGLIGDRTYTNPIDYVDDISARNAFIITDTVDSRAGLLSAEKIVDEAAIDEYTFVKDAYLQRRQSLVYDGDPPEKFDVFEE